MAAPLKRSTHAMDTASNSRESSTMSEASSTHTHPPLPAFIKKLWVIVNDKNNHDHIRWLDEREGDTICIPNIFAFSKRILPHYFKHNNWQSFVRQLNMYGFRRVYTPSKLNFLQATNDDPPDNIDYRLASSSSSSLPPPQTSHSSSMHTFRSSPVYLFKNDHFKRGEPAELHSIRRKVGTSATRVQQQQQQQHQEEGSRDDQTAASKEVMEVKERVGNKFNSLKQQMQAIETMHKSIVEETAAIQKMQKQQYDILSAVLDATGTLQSRKSGIGPNDPLVLSLQKFTESSKHSSKRSIMMDNAANSDGSTSLTNSSLPSSARSSDVYSFSIPLSHKFPSVSDGKSHLEGQHLPSINEAISTTELTDALPPLTPSTKDEQIASSNTNKI